MHEGFMETLRSPERLAVTLLLQLVICVGFFIALLAVLGSHMPAPWDFNPAGEDACSILCAPLPAPSSTPPCMLQQNPFPCAWPDFMQAVFARSAARRWCGFSGTCQLAAQAQPPSYQSCALEAGAQLVNGTLVNLGRTQFKFIDPSCSYPSAHLSDSFSMHLPSFGQQRRQHAAAVCMHAEDSPPLAHKGACCGRLHAC